MMHAVELTPEQAEQINGKEFAPDSFFLPVQDANGQWVISVREQIHCVNEDFMWIKSLPRIDWVAPEEILNH